MSSTLTVTVRSGLDLLGVETMPGVDFEVLDERVELLLGILVFVASAGNADTDSPGDITDSVDPDGSVEGVVHSHILSVHLLGGEPLDVSDRAGCALLELNSLESLMQMKSVIAASGLHFLFFVQHGPSL